MKRVGIVLTAVVLLLSPLAAQDIPLTGFAPKDARALGLGGAFTAVSEGFSSLYGNPAGFASAKGELTILAPTSWLYVRPTSDNLALLRSAAKDDGAAVDALETLLTDNGLGGGASLGIGYVGKGFGIGAFVTADAYAAGDTLAGAVMDVDLQFNAVLGLARTVKLFGLGLTLGGNLRPFYRAVGDIPLSEVVGAMMGDSDPGDVFLSKELISGFGLAADLGVGLELGSFKLGLAVRDIAPAFQAYSNTVQDLADSGFVTSSGTPAGSFALTPNVVLGASWHPDLGAFSRILDPRVLLEIQDPLAVIRDRASFFNLVHAGVEVEALGFLALRAGVNKGWLSAGVGLDLFFLEVDAAVFTEELGWRPGQNGRSGVALQAAIRL